MTGDAGHRSASSRKLDRALPQIFVDAMKNGLPKKDASDKRKVWAMVHADRDERVRARLDQGPVRHRDD